MTRRITHRIILCCLAAFIFAEPTTAQDQKIGYVDTDYILSQMSEYKGVQQQLRSVSSEWRDRLDEMEEEIKQLRENFQSKEILYSDEQKAQKKQEIQNKVQQRQNFLDQKFGADGEYFTRQKELLEPLQRKVFNAINTVAEQQNFDFIFDRAQNSSMLYSVQEWNLNEQVLQELGITLNDVSN